MTAPTKFGSEFLVNSTTNGFQTQPSITGLADGRFAVVWEDYSGTEGLSSFSDIRAQVFNADGSKSGAEFLVNTTTAAPQDTPDVTALPNGNFLVVWEDSSLDGSSADTAIRAQLFTGSGTKVGAEFVVNSFVVGGWHDTPRTAVLADGRFVVTWQFFSISEGDSIRAQVFNANGSKSGAEFVVNTTTSGAQSQASIAALANGGFVVTWYDESRTGADSSGGAIRGQMFNANGSKNGSEFLVNTTTTGDQGGPSVSAMVDGSFLVAWTDASLTANVSTEVRAQLFDANGSPSGAEFLVNTTIVGGQSAPSITTLKDGRFAVAWIDESTTGEDTSGYAVRAQVLNHDGSKAGPEFLVNTTTSGFQVQPRITTLADGRFAVTWRDDSQSADDPSAAVRAQIFDPRSSGVSLQSFATALDDQWVGTPYEDYMPAGLGRDLLDGRGGSDTAGYSEKVASVSVVLDGANWVDVNVGGLAEDRIRNIENLIGGSGDDFFFGDASSNTLIGQGGNDVLLGQGGNDIVEGGDGYNYLYGGEGDDALTGGGALFGEAGNDFFAIGAGAASYIDGGIGDDTAYGGDGDDIILMGDGNDRAFAGAGYNYIDLGHGDDVAAVFLVLEPEFEVGDQRYANIFLGGGGNDTLLGGRGADYLDGGEGADYLYGGKGNDILIGSLGNNVLLGGDGDDYILSGDGDDYIEGGAGNDSMISAGGNDVFNGGTGRDTAFGGPGDDIFIVYQSNGLLVVYGFAAGGTEDKVYLSANGFSNFAQVSAALTYYSDYDATVLTVDADTSVWLMGAAPGQVTAADFFFA